LQADATSAYFNLLIGGDGVSYGLLTIITTGGSQTVAVSMIGLQPTTIADTAGYFTTDTVEGALAEIGAKLAAYPSDVWEGGSYGS
ncbi:MAG: hypothetical protein MJZ20_12445, partial [Bacteroidaceae bacterium]|nr:hypothetical protein [Bacteroidaceae bacterium]